MTDLRADLTRMDLISNAIRPQKINRPLTNALDLSVLHSTSIFQSKKKLFEKYFLLRCADNSKQIIEISLKKLI